MSDINPVATQVIQSGQGQALSGSGSGVFASGNGVNFWDLILGQLSVSLEEGVPENQDQNAQLKLQQLLNGETPPVQAPTPELGQSAIAEGSVDSSANEAQELLNLFKLALIQGPDQQAITAQQAKSLEDVENQIAALNKFVDALNTGLSPETQEQTFTQSLIKQLKQQIDNLEVQLERAESGEIALNDIVFPSLIAFGLSPSELNRVTERIDEIEKKLGRDLTIEDIIAGVGGILPQPESTNPVLIVNTNDAPASQGVAGPSPAGTQPTDDLAAQLNNLVVGGTAEETVQPQTQPKQILQRELREYGIDFGKTQPDTANGHQATITTKKVSDNIQSLTQASAFQSESEGSFLIPQSWQQTFNQAMEALGIDLPSGLTFTPSAQAANITTQVQQAGHTHPATQMVSASLQKAAKDGTNQMTIQLDPPELGRVDVRIEFGKDNSIKAHMVIEKPETYMMLQRDAHMLERTIQQIGLDADGNSLSFELAQDQSDFDHNGKDSNSENYGSSDGSEAAEDSSEIIETTMTWNVDPETGYIRYNILA